MEQGLFMAVGPTNTARIGGLAVVSGHPVYVAMSRTALYASSQRRLRRRLSRRPPTAPPMAGAGGGAAATGDPHLQNVYGERFDLMRSGKHTLIQIPGGQLAENALLRVQADARQMGGHCADMYFQELNVTGAWVEAKRTGGFHYHAQRARDFKPKWEHFGKVDLKVVHGITKQGIRYLNFYVKNLARTGYAVGGLLGEDDHTEAAMPSEACGRHLSLLQSAVLNGHVSPEFSVAEASF